MVRGDDQGDNLKLLYKGHREYQIPKDPKPHSKGKAQVPDFIEIAALTTAGQKGTACQPECQKEEGQILTRRMSLVSRIVGAIWLYPDIICY